MLNVPEIEVILDFPSPSIICFLFSKHLWIIATLLYPCQHLFCPGHHLPFYVIATDV